jgi:hypothetical protein
MTDTGSTSINWPRTSVFPNRVARSPLPGAWKPGDRTPEARLPARHAKRREHLVVNDHAALMLVNLRVVSGLRDPNTEHWRQPLAASASAA